jgi:glycolate oxidase FAD binding subunit
MTEVTLKVMPRPEAESTILLRGLDPTAANRAMTAALGSPFDVSAAAHVPASTQRGEVGGLDKLGSPNQALTLLRLEGIAASVRHRTASLSEALRSFGTIELVEEAASQDAWGAVRDVQPFAADGPLGTWPVWRIVCPPASGGALGEALARETGGEVIYDWGGGLIWAALPPKSGGQADGQAHGQAALLRQRAGAHGGHAMLVRGSVDLRRAIDVFHPQPAGLRDLSERVRNSFDPRRILNRGRLSREGA